MTPEALNYGPYSEIAYEKLQGHVKKALVHELGHYVITKTIIREAEYFISLNTNIDEKNVDENIVVNTQVNDTKFRVSTQQNPNLTEESEKLICASGYAAEELFSYHREQDLDHQSDTDMELFKDIEEFRVYVSKAKQILAPYKTDIDIQSSKLAAGVITKSSGNHVFEEKDFLIELR